MSMISYNPYRSSLRGSDLNQLFNGLFPRMEEEETAAGYDWNAIWGIITLSSIALLILFILLFKNKDTALQKSGN